jgi:hypothetical protein
MMARVNTTTLAGIAAASKPKVDPAAKAAADAAAKAAAEAQAIENAY